MKAVLDALPPKMLSLDTGERVDDVTDESLDSRVENVSQRIQRATFTGKGDKPVVIGIYKDYVARLADMLQKTLALASVEAAPIEGPPMPSDTSADAMREWHMQTLRAQHAQIADALSGQRLDTLTQCVQITLKGKDAGGTPLAHVRDAAGMAGWLLTLGGTEWSCALLTAPAAAGKTWLMSQLIMRMLDNDAHTPILVKVERLQVELRQHRPRFEAAPDWVDAFLELTCKPPHYQMLRQEIDAHRAVLLIDGARRLHRWRSSVCTV